METADAVQLQRTVGLETTIAGQSGHLQIGILNRKATRRWQQSQEFIAAARKLPPDAHIEENYFEDKSPIEQAKWMNKQDLVISPHGAQLTNLIWARRCIGVLELFPRNYYIPGFFGALASVVGGRAFAGYPEGRDAANDTRPAISSYQVRAGARRGPVLADPESVAVLLNQVAAQQKKCAATYN